MQIYATPGKEPLFKYSQLLQFGLILDSYIYINLDELAIQWWLRLWTLAYMPWTCLCLQLPCNSQHVVGSPANLNKLKTNSTSTTTGTIQCTKVYRNKGRKAETCVCPLYSHWHWYDWNKSYLGNSQCHALDLSLKCSQLFRFLLIVRSSLKSYLASHNSDSHQLMFAQKMTG